MHLTHFNLFVVVLKCGSSLIISTTSPQNIDVSAVQQRFGCLIFFYIELQLIGNASSISASISSVVCMRSVSVMVPVWGCCIVIHN